ncbi:MAG: hypothetical protein K2X44_09575, partial [Magnetospirillum sp.]|nr:hypothetical protein [Magnetospirillum sp.]
MAKESFDSIASAVIEALVFLKKQKDLQGTWQDPANLWVRDEAGAPIAGGGEVMACEGLLSFLTALNRFGGRADLRQRITSIYPLDVLEQDVYELLERLRLGGVYGGRPYVHVLDSENREHPFLDITCYAISLMILAEAVLGEP